MCTVRLYVERFVQATRLPFNPGSPSHLSTRRCPTWRSAGARRSQWRSEHRRRKRAPEMSGAITERHTRTFLSQTGPQIQLELGQAGHHLVGFNTFRIAFRHKKRRPMGSPSLRFAMCARSTSVHTSLRGLRRIRAGASRRSYANTASPARRASLRRIWVGC